MKKKISHITGSLCLLLGLLFSTHFLALYPPINFSLSASSLSHFRLLSCPIPPLLFLSFIFHPDLSSFLLLCSLLPLFPSTPLLFPIFFSFPLLSFLTFFSCSVPSFLFSLLSFSPIFSFALLFTFPCSFSFPLLSPTLLSRCYLSCFPHISSFPFLSFPFPPLVPLLSVSLLSEVCCHHLLDRLSSSPSSFELRQMWTLAVWKAD